MEQKQRFVSMAGSGHFTMTELCRDFGISRKTGHKWVARHSEGGMKALEERSRASHRKGRSRLTSIDPAYWHLMMTRREVPVWKGSVDTKSSARQILTCQVIVEVHRTVEDPNDL